MEALQGLSGSEAPEMAPGGAPAATETADISREYQQLMTSICGTPLYLAPDVLEHGRRLMNGINFNIQTGRVRQDDRDKVIRTLNSDDGIMLGGGYSAAVDMWSLGVTLYILLVGYPPFHPQPGPNQLRLNDQIRTSEIVFHQPYWDTISDQAKNLVLGLLNRDPKKRLTARQALAHPWFST
ncbi:hypothetical protein H696_05501 [Fonticula alba]|uniref:Protein kinase domain-containing protein n=1 Tax=Fonticula alba TaxID=691883 RepID=A0A058Z295_FONAL|nr:hypothetical protein H696_05501 [Fonticula alba]KCV68033.1 hypothetical protein H696_05501 [Fonticula alba]|eukprot:XP_009497600.1 hypothetical protein H696_05501 [Fonticula alba]